MNFSQSHHNHLYPIILTKSSDNYITALNIESNIITNLNPVLKSISMQPHGNDLDNETSPSHCSNRHTRHVKQFRKQTSNDQFGVKNRLLSIINDSTHLTSFHRQNFPHLPIFANKRCGQWYIQPCYNTFKISQYQPNEPLLSDYNNICGVYTATGTPLTTPSRLCYYKSTDGHYNVWNFSLSRINLNVFEASMQQHTVINPLYDIIHYYHSEWNDHDDSNIDPFTARFQQLLLNHLNNDSNEINIPIITLRGACIIDSTRKGKEFPDSFSRTIPIWCGVLNQSLCSNTSDNTNHPTQLTNAYFSPPQWMLGTEIDQICDKINNNHIPSFLSNIGPSRTSQYQNIYNGAINTSSMHYSSATSPKLTPIWLHREHYTSTISILNNNLFHVIVSMWLPYIFSSISHQSECEEIHTIFTISYLYHFITKYNLGCYVTVFSYYNQQPIFNTALNNAIISQLNNFNKILNNNLPSQIPEISLISLIMAALSQVMHIPIILYSTSLVDRYIRSYNGSNVTSNNQFDSSIPTNPLYYRNTNIDIKHQVQSFSKPTGLPNFTDFLYKITLSNDNQHIQFMCPYTFSTVDYHTIFQSITNLQRPCGTSSSHFLKHIISHQYDRNHINLIHGLLHTHSIRHYKALNLIAETFHDENYIPGAGDDEETWAKIKVWAVKPSFLVAQRDNHGDEADGNTNDNIDGEDLPLILFHSTPPKELKDAYHRISLQCTFDMMYKRFTIDELKRNHKIDFALDDEIYSEENNYDDSFDEDDDDTNFVNFGQILPKLLSNEECWTIIYKLFYFHDVLDGRTSSLNDDNVNYESYRTQSFPIFQLLYKNTTISYNILPTSIATRLLLDVITVQQHLNLKKDAQSAIELQSIETISKPSHYMIVLEPQQQQKDITTKTLINAVETIQSNFCDTVGLYPLTMALSNNRMNKNSFLHHIARFLRISYDIFTSSSSENPSHYTIYLTNSTIDLYMAIIIALVLFFNDRTQNSDHTGETHVDLPVLSTLYTNNLNNFQNDNSLILENKKNDSTTAIVTLCLSTMKLQHPPIGHNTTSYTYSKQQIRQITTNVINTVQHAAASSSSSSFVSQQYIKNVTDAFLSRDLQQQINLFFCPKHVKQ